VAVLAIVVLGGTTGMLAHGVTVGSRTVSLLPIWQRGFGEERLMPVPGMPPDPDVCYYYGVFSVWVHHDRHALLPAGPLTSTHSSTEPS
jgi:hypothetical protein